MGLEANSINLKGESVRTGKAVLRAYSFRSRRMVESTASSTRPREESSLR